MNYEPVIGLEVHAQLLTETKIFCACSTRFGSRPNENTCPVCLGLPGVLPVLNKKVVEYAIRAGLATHCAITRKSVFARKNYFYPDLPKGYQISQYELPICQKGWIEIEVGTQKKRIGITRIHLEEDAGKSLHEHPKTRQHGASWVDLNRAGVALIETVSEPDIRSAEETVAYLKKFRAILVSLGICDGNMEEGSLRCDVNISLRPVGTEKFGTRAELKNMNSFKHIEKALAYEINRQASLLDAGKTITQETRLWNDDLGVTESMRSKEEAFDYRYFPDPDLLPLVVSDTWITEIEKSLPELPDAMRDRLIRDYQLTPYDAAILTGSRDLSRFFEQSVQLYPEAKKVANWIINEFLRLIEGDESRIAGTKITPQHLAKTLQLVDAGTISGSVAKTVLQKIFESGGGPEAVIAREGLAQVSDTGALEAAIAEIIAANPDQVAKYKGGNEKLIGFFVGLVMKKTQGRGNPGLINKLLKDKLG